MTVMHCGISLALADITDRCFHVLKKMINSGSKKGK